MAIILINVNSTLDKKDFKKSIKKAGKVLYRGAKRKGNKNPIEIMNLASKS